MKPAARRPALLLLAAAFPALGGCLTHTVKIEQDEPIHITLDVRLRVKVDEELDSFFEDLDRESAALEVAAVLPDPADSLKGEGGTTDE